MIRDALFRRCGGRCEFCGKPMLTSDVHHRKLRSQGGDESLDNLVLVHPYCHERAHHYPHQAREWGWIVPSWADPAEVACRVVRPD